MRRSLQGQRIRLTDQNATVHEFDYDKLGRQTQDRVTQVGLGIDDAVRRIDVSYDVRGLVNQVSSHDDRSVGVGTLLNQVTHGRNCNSRFMPTRKSAS